MARIYLTNGGFTLINDEDALSVSKHRWFESQGYVYRSDMRPLLSLHRFLMNAGSGTVLDHINGNPLDNRRENLRFCTEAQNHYNRRLNKDNTSGFKGVWFRKTSKRWQAEIRVNGKKRRLGCFQSKEDAAKRYNEAAREHFGEFARLNLV